MLRGGYELTEVEKGALEREAERIAALGDAWEPTLDNLTEVLLAVKAASHDAHIKVQRQGVAAAQAEGVRFGRPKKKKPKNFERYVKMIDNGELTRIAVAKALGVSRDTLNGWLKEWKAQNENEK